MIARVTALAAALFWLLAAPAGAEILAAWSQYVAGGGVEARLITDAPLCPSLALDGKSYPMTERGSVNAEFPSHLCSFPITPGSKRISVMGRDLPAPVAKPRHIVVIGDTGCRLKALVVQNCNDENAWPFLKVAAHAAAEHPDLVIHVGDYLYRESPCLPLDGRCAGTPWGDNWPTWNADFFTPAAALLAQAPIVAARGNHENCKRAGPGFIRYLGHDPLTVACARREAPMLVDLGGVRVAVLDDNDADDQPEVIADVADALSADIARILPAKPDWIVTHHPFRGVAKISDGKTAEGGNLSLLAALKSADESGLSLLLAGHIHNFQIANFASPLAPQMVVGESGDLLDTHVPPDLTGLISGGVPISAGLSLPGFGYVVMDRDGDGQDWRIAVHAVDGALLKSCSLNSRHLGC